MTNRKQQWIDDHYKEQEKAHKHLVSVLKSTKDSKSALVQDLRRTAIKYFNDTEKYIAEIEIENIGLSIEVGNLNAAAEFAKKQWTEVYDILMKRLRREIDANS